MQFLLCDKQTNYQVPLETLWSPQCGSSYYFRTEIFFILMALDKTMDSKFDFPIFFYKTFPYYGTSPIFPVFISELNKLLKQRCAVDAGVVSCFICVPLNSIEYGPGVYGPGQTSNFS